MKKVILLIGMVMAAVSVLRAVDLKRCQVVVAKDDVPLVQKMAHVLSEDVERVTGVRPQTLSVDALVTKGGGVTSAAQGGGLTGEDADVVILATVDKAKVLCPDVPTDELQGAWERYKILTRGKRLIIVGSDARGLAYGVLHVSERMGVSPWYWWADVPVQKRASLNYKENYTSESPSVKYRGIFINDEDWGLKTWSSRNFEKELNDIGPKTYDKVCELILRLKGNMLAPAMHSCTGAFYSHPESQQVASSWGIMITTSHCEPMLFNNAAHSEWDKARDGEWNYLTNKETIWKKFDDRLRETAQYDNIYTTGMRGLHDEAMKGSTDPQVRARTLEQVFADQRQILETHKRKAAADIPQIFVPYKETLDIYDAGLRVPEDITLVWPDDNYGYMKRVSNADERQRKGGSGVYYHLSYLGTPHDNLWIATTAPVLMYEELKKAYDAGADRYWLLNVGDIKPMEMEMQHFFDMAWNLSAFTYEKANSHQATWLASLFGKQYEKDFQQILDTYYRLAWDRKPEFMGYEMEWDSQENNLLHDTDFSFGQQPTADKARQTAQQRLADYQRISDRIDIISRQLSPAMRPAFFEIIAYSVKSAYQMNRKFLMAQRNHETGSALYAQEAQQAHDSIQTLLTAYNMHMDGKWNQMLSQIPPGYCAKYQLMPELVTVPTNAHRLPDDQQHPTYTCRIDLSKVKVRAPFRLIEGIGTDWLSLQMGEPLAPVQNPASLASSHIDIPFSLDASTLLSEGQGEISVCISTVPFWPVSLDRSNRIGVSLDGCPPVVCENLFEEWSYPWKLQVLENRKDYCLTFPIDRTKRAHTLTLIVGDPGQIIQKITLE
ncbi:MAG: glycosyl hydrolase 115 family protein [Bacteroidaceae bacterium]|nr:glycosyl hydrolase 115 family protein [Bacteroidaceae bacterium]